MISIPLFVTDFIRCLFLTDLTFTVKKELLQISIYPPPLPQELLTCLISSPEPVQPHNILLDMQYPKELFAFLLFIFSVIKHYFAHICHLVLLTVQCLHHPLI